MPAIGGGERYFQSDPYSEPEISSYSIRLSYPAMDDLLGLIIIDGSHNYNSLALSNLNIARYVTKVVALHEWYSPSH